MKKLFLLLALIPVICQAQFIISPKGMTTEDGKGFYVYKTTGTQAEIYKKLKSAITTIYVSAQKVMSESAPELMTISGTATSSVLMKNPIRDLWFDMHYSITIRVKDGKIRFDAPSISIINSPEHRYATSFSKEYGSYQGYRMSYIYDKNGKLKLDKSAKSINKYYENLINSIISAYNENEDEDW